MKKIYILPNLCTALNVFSGTFSIVFAIEGYYAPAAVAILAACCFDFLDGIIARAQRAGTAFGKEFDSLADVLSFGMAPAVLMYLFHRRADLGPLSLKFGLGVVFLFVVACALRLARYNVQATSEERRWFSGLPSPGAGGMVATYVLMAHTHPWAMLPLPAATAMMLSISILMVSRVRYPSSTSLHLFRKKPFVVLVGASVVIVALVAFLEVAFCALFAFYTAFGPARYLYYRYIKGLAIEPPFNLLAEARAGDRTGTRRPRRWKQLRRHRTRHAPTSDTDHL
ncbi:MAG: CDP-diacylglycerol--serine O-phosphatidyltransferase [Verrucomicrobia bacterium]|nr:CDP-diacylglycerol--serine O-phosphatidyltransferase [Verrucomicrobiota bacterium]